MAYIVLKTGWYEFGDMHIESQLDRHTKNEEVQDHKYFIVRLIPDSGVYLTTEDECEPANVIFEFDNFTDANHFFEGVMCQGETGVDK